MPGDGNMVRCERYKKTPRIPRPSHNRYYYTRSLVIDAKNRPRHQRSRCQSAPRVMDRSHSRSASPRDPARPQHRPPSPPSPPAFENKAYQHDEHDANHNDSFNSNGNSNGHKEPNGDSKTLEAVNLELINLTPKNGHAKKKDVEVDISGSNPYDEYFVPVNEHRKYMRGEKLYVTADKRGEKGGCKRPLCWTLLGLVVAAIVALIVLAATGILFASSPTPLEPYNASVSSARALGGITHVTTHDHKYTHDHDHDHHGHGQHDHDGHETTTENEYESSTDRNQDTDSSEERGEIMDNPEPQAPESTSKTLVDNSDDHSLSSNESDNSMLVPRTVEGELKIDNKEFSVQLEDPDSDEYAEFVNSFTEALTPAIVYRSPLGNGQNDVKIEIVKIRNESGSIVVTYRIHWEPKYYNANSDDLLTPAALESILKNYLARNDRMISTYHIADDKMSTRPVLDICKMEKNGCDYECQFNNETLDFTCICPRGQIQDMKHPKQCVPLLNAAGTGSSSIVDVFVSVTTPMPTPEPKPNTESITTEKEMQDTSEWKSTSNHMVETTTESDADVSFSHIFGDAATESEGHNTDIYKQQTESSEEQNGMTTRDFSQIMPDKSKIHTTTMSDLLLPTTAADRVAEPAPEPEPTPETKSYSEIYDQNNVNDVKQPGKTEEPQPNPEPEPEPEIIQQIIPILTTTTEVHLGPESQTTTEQIIIPAKQSEPHFVFEQVITAEEPNNTEIMTTTDVPLVTVTDNKYDLKSHYNLEHHVGETTINPLEAQFYKKSENNSGLHIRLQENNNEVTTVENEWLEDTLKPEIHKSDNDSNETPEEGRSSKAFSSEFNVDELINQLHTTLQYNDTEIEESTTTASDLLNEEITTATQVPTTTAVSISQIFFGNKPNNETLKNLSPSTKLTTIIPVLTEFEGSINKNVSAKMDMNGNMQSKNQMPTFEDVTVSAAYPGHFPMTTTSENPNQIRSSHLDQNLLTMMNNTESVHHSKTEINGTPEDVTETDITFDAINQLFNRSSKSFQSETLNPEVVASEINDIYKEMTDTTTASDWLTETVSEMNYQDVVNENKNRETTEAPVTKLDEIISREMNRDDFEPDYLNMGSKTSKSIEHDEPLYGMLQDYDNEESISKRVKNEPGKMVEDTTKRFRMETTNAMNNLMEENIITIKPTTEANTFETTTISEYIYKLSSTENNTFITTTSNPTTVHSVPQVWEKPEEDLNFTEKEIPKDLSNTLVTEPGQNISSQNTMSVEESVTQSDNMTQGNNLNVTIYEISNHKANQSLEKSTNHQSAEYDDHETEMNPFLPEIENNKSLVKKLQEGHDIEPSNVNETQNENLEEQGHRNLDGSAKVNNQTGISNKENVISSSPQNKDVKTVYDDTLFNDHLTNKNASGSEERSQVSNESIRDMDTTQTPYDQLDDDATEVSDQNFSLPTFLMDTDDLDPTKEPFDRVSQNIDIKSNKTELRGKSKDDNNFLSVVPIEQDNVEEKQNLKNNYDRENISELNIISDSPKKSDRRTVDSSNVNSLFNNEA